MRDDGGKGKGEGENGARNVVPVGMEGGAAEIGCCWGEIGRSDAEELEAGGREGGRVVREGEKGEERGLRGL